MELRFNNKFLDASGAMMISDTEQVEPERTRLNFANVVERRLAFLAEFGFSQIESLPMLVRYKRGDLDLNVYHGRRSLEIGLQIGHGQERFSISELVRATDPVAAEKYRNPAATTAIELEAAVDRVAELLRLFGKRALCDDPEFFVDLRRQRKSWSEAYALDVLADQIRPKAEAAFREGRYQDATELYERIAPRLSAAEQQKLAVARKRG